jgi:hypothetical protein
MRVFNEVHVLDTGSIDVTLQRPCPGADRPYQGRHRPLVGVTLQALSIRHRFVFLAAMTTERCSMMCIS